MLRNLFTYACPDYSAYPAALPVAAAGHRPAVGNTPAVSGFAEPGQQADNILFESRTGPVSVVAARPHPASVGMFFLVQGCCFPIWHWHNRSGCFSVS